MKTNYKFGTVLDLEAMATPSDTKVQFKQIFETGNGGVNIVAFKKGQDLDTHTAPAEVMLIVLDGEITFTMNTATSAISKGQFILMGADVPHSVVAKTDATVMLVKIKPD